MQLIILSISLVLFTGYAALILYYRHCWLKIPCFTPGEAPPPPIKISIIVPARNEEQNIIACLDSICNQTYPPELYEVIVVDDYSTDDTASIVKNYASKNVKLISLKDFTKGQTLNSYKKKAIEIAVAQSAGELIVTTDADCIATPEWSHTHDRPNLAFRAAPVQ